jgi:superoxide reductase
MTEKFEIYKCSICGNIVEVINDGKGALVCCGEPMEHLCEKSNDDAAQEKHVPVIVTEGETKTIRVGSIPHPMVEEHYIMFIEAISKDKKQITRKYLYPEEKAEMNLKDSDNTDVTARELCNIHGLWTSDK